MISKSRKTKIKIINSIKYLPNIIIIKTVVIFITKEVSLTMKN
jgi:hypothetical protein